MINDRKKIVVVISAAIIIVGIILVIFIKNINDRANEQTSTTIEDTKADNDVIVDDITFSNITKVYDGGITTITAEMLNNTSETKEFKLQIILKDEDGKEVKSVMQVIENLESNKTKILTTGIAGDYTNIKNIEFKVMENE